MYSWDLTGLLPLPLLARHSTDELFPTSFFLLFSFFSPLLLSLLYFFFSTRLNFQFFFGCNSFAFPHFLRFAHCVIWTLPPSLFPPFPSFCFDLRFCPCISPLKLSFSAVNYVFSHMQPRASAVLSIRGPFVLQEKGVEFVRRRASMLFGSSKTLFFLSHPRLLFLSPVFKKIGQVPLVYIPPPFLSHSRSFFASRPS